ncbi:unnamed protein product [Zymoseptoria tritici ST99CH_3D1]|nr:unnamed protein product [Zymoseptoria tritici ST99CH_1E4]SMR59442.1 unnamed protein product [Zymoseptoria tritici ST99CH_3D1]
MEKPPEYAPPPSSSLAEPPPAYEDAFTEASISDADSSHSAVLHIGSFPSRFNWYYKTRHWKSYTYHLGEHAKLPLFALTFDASWRGTAMSLHRGVDSEKTLMAEAFSESKASRHSIILLPSPRDGEQVREELHCNVHLSAVTYSFSMRVPGRLGEKPVVEQFEWRQSHGSEVRSLDKHGWGYKLVRLQSSSAVATPPDSVTKSAGKKAVRHDGLTSDGKEVVAVWADSSEWSKNKTGKFQFRGSGATGELGEDWATFAVMSGLRIWGVVRLGVHGGKSSAS